MSRLMLQLFGGGLYLLNKIFLNLMERKRVRSVVLYWRYRQLAWIVYLVGLPFIVIMFFRERNWIFGFIELGGAPAMLCGIVTAFSKRNPPIWLERLAFVAIPLGLGYSLYDFGGITTFTQLLEVLGSAGFLVGTYLLAKDRGSGYFWFTLMNLATGWLLYVEGYPWFVPQQIISVILTLDALRVRIRNRRLLSEYFRFTEEIF